MCPRHTQATTAAKGTRTRSVGIICVSRWPPWVIDEPGHGGSSYVGLFYTPTGAPRLDLKFLAGQAPGLASKA
jgi:hypothetical protein